MCEGEHPRILLEWEASGKRIPLGKLGGFEMGVLIKWGEANLGIIVGRLAGGIIEPQSRAMVAETMAVLQGLKIMVESGLPRLELQPFLLHSLLLVGVLMTPQCLRVCEFLETVLALKLPVLCFHRRG